MNAKIMLLTLLFTIHVNAQWEIINEGVTGYINDIDFFNENIGWIECDQEVFLTTNGGDSWNSVYYTDNIDDRVRDAAFVNDLVGWVINNGKLIKTLDGGISWIPQLSEIYNLQVLNDSLLFVIGVSIKMSVDGGNNWQILSLPHSNNNERSIIDLYFINQYYGFITIQELVDDYIKSIVWKTIDGGINWDITTSANDLIEDLFFLNDSVGYLCKGKFTTKKLYSTINSGKAWAKIYDGALNYFITSNDEIYVIEYDDDCANPESKVYVSKDNGNSWLEVFKQEKLIHKIFITKNNRTFLIEGPRYFSRADRSSANQILDMNDDGFNTHTWETVVLTEPLISIGIFNKNKWIMAGYDGGLHWGYSNLTYTSDGGNDYDIMWGGRSFYCVNEKVGYCEMRSDIYKTEDGGINWEKVSENISLSDMYFINSNMGWGFDCNEIRRTENGGIDWSLVCQGPGDISSIYFLNNNRGWVIGNKLLNDKSSGFLIQYDSINGWTQPNDISNLPLRKIKFIDKDIGFILGGYNNDAGSVCRFLKTIDGGNTWSNIYDMEYLINDFYIYEDGSGWAVGNDINGKGIILGINNFGDNWYVEWDNIIYRLNAIAVRDSFTIAVGNNGLIVGSENITSVKPFCKSLELSNRYLSPKHDTLLINTEIVNSKVNSIIVYALIKNGDGSLLDTVYLNDNGIGNDEIAYDDNWNGEKIFIEQPEDIYNVSLYLYDQDLNTTRKYHQEEKFTTAGPIVIDTFSVIYLNDSLVVIKDLFLKNNGEFKELNAISAKLVCIDSSISKITNSLTSFGKIEPGQSRKSITAQAYIRKETCAINKFILEISSGDKQYWVDTLKVVNPSPNNIIISNKLSNEYDLSNNYPNPFNPSTTIKYTIPSSSVMLNSFQHLSDLEIPNQVQPALQSFLRGDDNVNVALKVYDILGREVATLVNEKQKPGIYEVEWNADNYGSGIYFYRIISGDYIQTKKMVLLK